MSDAAHSTASSTATELDTLIADGFPPVNGPDEDALRERAEDLAMAVAYTWLSSAAQVSADSTAVRAAQDSFVDEIVGLSGEGAGLMFAVELFNRVRLLGVDAGTVRPDITVTVRGTPSLAVMSDQGRHYPDNIEIITELWSGHACGDLMRTTRAKAILYEMPLPQLRDVLRTMAFDISGVMDCVAGWQGIGSELFAAYERAHPPANTSTDAAPDVTQPRTA